MVYVSKEECIDLQVKDVLLIPNASVINVKKSKSIQNGEKCSSHYACASKSACHNDLFTSTVSANDDCHFTDHLCPFNYACVSTSKDSKSKCIKMFSLDIGSSHPLLCKTGYIYEENSKTYLPEEESLYDYTLKTYCA